MTNDERLQYALMGILLGGGVIGVIAAPAFILADINPLWWFVFAFFICAPLGGLIGWHNADRFETWAKRK